MSFVHLCDFVTPKHTLEFGDQLNVISGWMDGWMDAHFGPLPLDWWIPTVAVGLNRRIPTVAFGLN